MLLNHLNTLAALRAAVEEISNCPLKTPTSRTVFAGGNPAAKLMLIGEAPGAEEDRLGEPFVGRSGQLLNKLLAQVGITRQGNLYITNTVFWRPPNNRPPTPAEIAICWPYLQRHIALIKPSLVLVVGATAAKTVLQTKTPIGQLRGQWHALPNPYLSQPIPTMVTFHPAFLLRNPPATPTAQEDLKAFAARAVQLNALAVA